jgi:hypothetical protein
VVGKSVDASVEVDESVEVEDEVVDTIEEHQKDGEQDPYHWPG